MSDQQVTTSQNEASDQQVTTPQREVMDDLNKKLELMSDQFALILPEHISVQCFIRVVLTAVNNEPKLLKCARSSLFNACIQAAHDGLLPDGRDGVIVPFWSSELRLATATWMPMYQGLLKKVRNSGELKTIAAHVVYDNDEFSYCLGDDEHIKHIPF